MIVSAPRRVTGFATIRNRRWLGADDRSSEVSGPVCVGDKERAFRCGACGEVFDLKQDAPPEPARPERPPAPKKAAIDETRIEDELAELKKRLGR